MKLNLISARENTTFRRSNSKDTFLYSRGGPFYLLNKVHFSRAERAKPPQDKQRQRVWAWAAYMAGLPPWVIIFISEHNWIAASVELGGAPAMLTGLINAWRGRKQSPLWLDHLSKLMLVIGLGLSLYDFGGITTLNQVLELGVAFGFLIGTYMLAKEKPYGYFWLILGNISAASLMGLEGYLLLMTQQIISLGFVIDAYWGQWQRNKVIR